MDGIRFGVDLGGSKIEIIALDPQGRELLRRRVATPREDYRATLEAVARLVEQAETDLDTRGTLGIGTPGARSHLDGRMKNCNSTWLNGQPLYEDLRSRLDREIRMANDANCFALSEASDGAAQAGVVFGVIVGTGTGAGVVVDGRVLDGANGIAGEWGHNPLPWPEAHEYPGPACYCGQRGCIETWLSGPGMARDFRDNHCLDSHSGTDKFTPGKAAPAAPDAAAIAAAARAGDPAATATLRRYESRMARALAQIINILDPDIIVLGGGMSCMSNLYENVPKLWDQWVFSDGVRTRLLPPKHGDSSGVRGAACLWPPNPPA